MKFYIKVSCITLVFALFACSSKILKYEKADSLKQNNEYESQVVIVKPEPAPPVLPDLKLDELGKAKNVETPSPLSQTPVVLKKKKGKKKAADEVLKADSDKNGKDVTSPLNPSAAREPDIEDSVGFQGRRPLVDPFRVGETIKMSVRYFKLNAGILNLKVEPFSVVNGRKSYSFVTEVKSASFFSNIYTADDRVESFVDFETLIPHTYSLHVTESGQLREAQCFFDHKKNHATFWEKKYTEKNGHEERKQSWDILPYSQNVFSAIFYMRFFKWEVGKEIAFRVAHDEENIVFRGKAIRQEKLETEAGTFDSIVIKPEFQVKGAFKPVGEIYFWISNDDRRYILKVESSIKIGTLVAEAIEITPGQ